ncbi:DUF4192 domain-containing protein [Ruania zhangjianzhongii]|uniref:DUF4192 domain-containing protein n=1 Tax=Ruania zhangjianzhongii TaxID=2603206 RepID=UPI0011C79A8B|nr:DUF4192 domain-containing protein [Ruania zhangjianzhongii]
MDEITPYPRTDHPTNSRGPAPDAAQRAAASAAAEPRAEDFPDPDTPEATDDRCRDRATLHLDRPAEVLAWLPYQVKFWPQESAVLLSLRRGQRAGPSSDGAGASTTALEPGLIARTDLAVIGGLADGRQAQVDMGRHLQRDGAHRALCAIYTDQSFASVLRGQGPAGRTLTWWRTTPWAELGKTYLIGPERFRCVDCADAPCCPHTGQPLEVLDNTESAAWHVFHGHGYVRDRRLLVPDLRASTQRRRAVGAAARRHYDQRPDLPGKSRSDWHREMEYRWVALVKACAKADRAARTTPAGTAPEQATLAEQLPAGDLGAVLAGLADPWVRDAALLWSGTGQLLGDAVRDNVVDAVFSGRLLPQMRRLHAADRTLTVLGAHATDRWKAPVLASRAWLAWWSGEGAKANILLERSLRADPDYSLAQLLGTALAHGIPPGWARSGRLAS